MTNAVVAVDRRKVTLTKRQSAWWIARRSHGTHYQRSSSRIRRRRVSTWVRASGSAGSVITVLARREPIVVGGLSEQC